jgi:hypothetical protein
MPLGESVARIQLLKMNQYHMCVVWVRVCSLEPLAGGLFSSAKVP